MSSRRACLTLAFAVLVAPAGATAQLPKGDPSVLQAQIAGGDPLTVTGVDPDGTIFLGPSEPIVFERRDNLGGIFVEGYYLLVINGDQARGERRVLRVQVTDVAASTVSV
jgi:hypothetical protein